MEVGHRSAHACLVQEQLEQQEEWVAIPAQVAAGMTWVVLLVAAGFGGLPAATGSVVRPSATMSVVRPALAIMSVVVPMITVVEVPVKMMSAVVWRRLLCGCTSAAVP